MDEYTSRTRQWLEARFSTREGERYEAHQPVSGIDDARAAGVLRDYVRIYRVLRALAHLRFETLLDVGAAEGFVAALASRLFGARVEAADLSAEACARAREMFGIRATAADAHALPFADESFDVVVCAETLEHVTDPGRALSELLRVARSAVVVSVPHEPAHVVSANHGRGEPHAHLHSFDEHSFDGERARGEVHVERILSSLGRIPFALLEAREPSPENRARWGIVARLYERARPLLRTVPAGLATRAGLFLDAPLCRLFPGHDGVLAVITKRPGVHSAIPRAHVRPGDVLSLRASGAP